MYTINAYARYIDRQRHTIIFIHQYSSIDRTTKKKTNKEKQKITAELYILAKEMSCRTVTTNTT